MTTFGRPSTGNSTTTPLPPSGIFLGIADDVSNFASVGVLYTSAGNGSTIHVEMGSTPALFQVDHAFNLSAGEALDKIFAREGRYLRVRIINDAGAVLSPTLYSAVHIGCPIQEGVTDPLGVNVLNSALPTGAATEASLLTRSTEATLGSMSAKLPAALGPQASAGSLSVVPATGAAFAFQPASSSVYRNLSLGTTGAVIKATAGGVYSISIRNLSALADAYVKLYDKATAPTNADTPIMTLALAASNWRNWSFTSPVAFANGLGVRASGAPSDGDNSPITANALIAEAITYT